LFEKLVMKGGFSRILYKKSYIKLMYIFACYIYYIIYYKFYKEETTFLF